MKRSASSVRKTGFAAAPSTTVEKTAGGEPDNENVVTSYRWAWYGLSLLVPFAGIFIAIFLYDQESHEVRKVGRNCLIIGFLFWIVFPVLMMLAIFLMVILVGFQMLSDVLPAGY